MRFDAISFSFAQQFFKFRNLRNKFLLLQTTRCEKALGAQLVCIFLCLFGGDALLHMHANKTSYLFDTIPVFFAHIADLYGVVCLPYCTEYSKIGLVSK